ncbi:MAG: ATP-binding cassette domain-containing protein [Phycisphaerae bacterium]|nr:ATP-binding cassette domain-containing protein [Phycisphaerae bacterium]
MPLAALIDARVAHGTQVVLDGVTLAVDPGERLGLVGRNGQGKSTILRLLAGRLEPDSGSVQVERSVRVGYLPQIPDLDPGWTVRGAAESVFSTKIDLEQRLAALFERMAHAAESELPALLRRQAELEHRLDEAGGYATDHLVDQALLGVGLEVGQFDRPVSVLSGGQRGRLGLARVLLERPDLLLLDEPTNHLDLEGRAWLENFLADSFAGAVILVSHDRWLLDRVVDRIEEIELGRLSDYPGNYAEYRALRAERQRSQARVRQKQLDHIRREEAYIRRYRAGQRAREAQGRQTRLDRFKRGELVERPAELEVFSFTLPPAPRMGDHALVARGISKGFGGRRLFHALDLSIEPGERVGIVGPNGAGKTTLVRCLLGDEPLDAGSVRVSPQLRTAWFRQTQEHLDPALTVWQYLQSVIVGEDGAARASEQQSRDLAGAFLFSGADQEKPLGALSGGERSRAVVAGLVAGARNLLVLDEPTNHLDIPSTERLEAALATPAEEGGYGGALILISHDRALLANVCDRLVVLDGAGGATEVRGEVAAWLEAFVESRRGRSQEGQAAEASGARRDASASAPRGDRRRSGGAAAPGSHAPEPGAPALRADAASDQQRAVERERAKFARLAQDELERRIESLESELRSIDERLGSADAWTNADAARRLTQERERRAAELAPLEQEWSRRADRAS